MNDIKIHHWIVLASLVVSLIGTLLILEKINTVIEPIPTATVVVVADVPEQENNDGHEVEVRITPLYDD